MQSETGMLGLFKSEKEAKEKGFDVPLTNKQYEYLKPLTRNQRKRWRKKLRQGKG